MVPLVKQFGRELSRGGVDMRGRSTEPPPELLSSYNCLRRGNPLVTSSGGKIKISSGGSGVYITTSSSATFVNSNSATFVNPNHWTCSSRKSSKLSS